MKVLPRTQFGDPILRTRARNVPLSVLRTTAFRNLVRQMFYTMHRASGIGLAAPQVGKAVRLAVIHVPPDRAGSNAPSKPFRRVVLNPRIVRHSKEKSLDWEGCLSFPGARGLVPRWTSIAATYINERGEKVFETHRGFIARVFQHEIDHLNGTVYVDRMKDMKTLMTHKEFLKRLT